jgi:hypothetical protein
MPNVTVYIIPFRVPELFFAWSNWMNNNPTITSAKPAPAKERP